MYSGDVFRARLALSVKPRASFSMREKWSFAALGILQQDNMEDENEGPPHTH